MNAESRRRFLMRASAHLRFDINNLGPAFEDAHALGAKYATSSSLQRPESPMSLQHYFAEQEGPFARMSQLQAAQVAYDYLRSLD